VGSFLDVLRGRMAQRRSNAFDTLADAARAVADDKAADSGAVESALVETRQTVADFEELVQTARQRSQWRSHFEQLASASGKVQKLEAKLAAEEQHRMEVLRASDEKLSALRQELSAASTMKQRGEEAKARLTDPKAVPGSIGEAYRQAVEDHRLAEAEVEQCRRQLREARERIKSEEGWVEQLKGSEPGQPTLLKPAPQWSDGTSSGRLEEHGLALKRWQRRGSEAEEALKQAEAALAKAEKAVEQLLPKVVAA
jgi:hypothetical protein